ncbi:MAG: hypothetical protein DMF98_15590, partial [Acidobacteria bacterium]
STSLYNAVYIALKDLKKVVAKNTDEIRRQAIIVLSDGEDTSSLLPFEEVLDLAKRSETAIYSIGLRSAEGPSTSMKGFKEAEFVLRQFAQETGGRAFFPTQVADLTNIYGQIGDELSSQYTVGYTSKNQRRDGGWRRIVVRREEQRSQRGCIAGRMQLEFHHGLLGARLTDDSSIPSTRTSAPSWLLHFLPRRHETTKKALGYILRAFFVSS